MLILALAALGLVVLVIEVFTVRIAWRVFTQSVRDHRKTLVVWMLMLGALLAVGTFVWPLILSYQYRTQSGVGRIIGVPFFAAFFDAEGLDYTGPLTLPAALANAFVWGLLPVTIYWWTINRRSSRPANSE